MRQQSSTKCPSEKSFESATCLANVEAHEQATSMRERENRRSFPYSTEFSATRREMRLSESTESWFGRSSPELTGEIHGENAKKKREFLLARLPSHLSVR
jgi:hypothetical protein